MRTRMMLVASLMVVALAACGGDDDDTADSADTTATTSGATSGITIEGSKFAPNPASAKVGESISVTNKDGALHSVTADDRSFDTGKFDSGSKTIKVDKAGTVAYHCEVHPSSMKGTIVVS